MCGIASFFYYNAGSKDADVLNWLHVSNRVQRSRGPGGEGVWVSEDGFVGLAHRRLAIINLSSAGAQPMAREGGLLRITYNGEDLIVQPARAGGRRIFEFPLDRRLEAQNMAADQPKTSTMSKKRNHRSLGKGISVSFGPDFVVYSRSTRSE
jgi:hypothetical protein